MKNKYFMYLIRLSRDREILKEVIWLFFIGLNRFNQKFSSKATSPGIPTW